MDKEGVVLLGGLVVVGDVVVDLAEAVDREVDREGDVMRKYLQKLSMLI